MRPILTLATSLFLLVSTNATAQDLESISEIAAPETARFITLSVSLANGFQSEVTAREGQMAMVRDAVSDVLLGFIPEVSDGVAGRINVRVVKLEHFDHRRLDGIALAGGRTFELQGEPQELDLLLGFPGVAVDGVVMEVVPVEITRKSVDRTDGSSFQVRSTPFGDVLLVPGMCCVVCEAGAACGSSVQGTCGSCPQQH